LKDIYRRLTFTTAMLALMSGGLVVNADAQLATMLASVGSQGQGNGPSPVVGAVISGNGRYVAFRSIADNLAGALGDTNSSADIFVRDLLLNQTTRVSVTDNEEEAFGGDSNNPSITADGRFVAFTSWASNLVPNLPAAHRPLPGDFNNTSDVFVRDTLLGTTTLVSVSPEGVPGIDISDSSSIAASADGQSLTVVFRSLDMGGFAGSQVFARVLPRDPVTGGISNAGTTTLVSASSAGVAGNGQSGLMQTSISGDGLHVAFTSAATNLVASDSNGCVDVFVRHLLLGTTDRASVSSTGLQGNDGSFCATLNGNGTVVAFTSYASNLVSGDSGGQRDVFVRDLQGGATTRVSLDSSGKPGNGYSGGTNDGNGKCGLSTDGRYVTFQSNANNLIGANKDKNGFQDIFHRDRMLGKTTMVSVTPAGAPANGTSSAPSTSADGLRTMFCSDATNLVAADSNAVMDVFVRR
jgi:hypothetical protein